MKRKIFSKLLMGAFLIASVSMFVSCKDYDDDISKNSQEITALKSQLESLKSTLSSELSAAKSELNNALANKANASDLDKKADASDLTALVARVAALETQIKAIDECATKSDLDAVKVTLAALTGELDKAATADDIAKAVEAQNKIQTDALEAFKKEIEAKGYLTGDALTEMQKNITDLQDKLSKIDVNAAIEDIQKKSQALFDELKQKVNEEIATMRLFVVGKLTSIVFKPNFYWEGLEAVELPYVKNNPVFKPVGKYEFNYWVTDGWDYVGVSDGSTYGTLGKNVIKVRVDTVMSVELKNKVGDYNFVVLEGYDGKEAFHNGDSKSRIMQKDALVPNYHYWTLRKHSGRASLTKSIINELAQQAKSGNTKGTPKIINIKQPALMSYHINPATADIENGKISFYDNYAGVYTRQEVSGSIEAKPVSGAEIYTKAGEGSKWNTSIFDKGILQIPLDVNYDKVWQYFYEWAFKNDTEVTMGHGSADANGPTDNYSWWYYEPIWDGDNFVYGHWNNTGTQDEYGNDIWEYVVEGTGYTSAFGTSADTYTIYNDDWTIKDQWKQSYDAKLPFIAAQIEAQDTVVTSDYAVVVPAFYNIVALADNGVEEDYFGTQFSKSHYSYNTNYRDKWGIMGYGTVRANHLYESVGYSNAAPDDITKFNTEYDSYSYGAIPMPATHTVKWNGSIDLKPFIETHFDYTSYAKYGQSTRDKVMTQEMLDALGLHYNFTIIDYYKGEETTSQSAHIVQTSPGVFEPREVDDQGRTLGTQNRNTIDREPLIRVDLVDADGNIVRYGYVKLRIVDTDTQLEVTVDFPDQYMNCGTEVRLTWAQVENLILSKLGDHGYTKQEFEKSYFMDVEAYPLPSSGYVGNMPILENGKLYGVAASNSMWARRYVKTGTETYNGVEFGKYEYAANKATDEATAFDNKHLGKNTATSNWFGRVWYTPHDNATNPQSYDEQTNVLVWNLYAPYTGTDNVEHGGNMTKNLYHKLMEVTGVTWDSQGTSTKDLSTTICFVNKTTKSKIYVTLRIPAGKLHFEYGEVGNKDWAHWFQFNSPKAAVSATAFPYWEEFDTHTNPAVPAENGYNNLTVTSLHQKLTDYWLDPANMVAYKAEPTEKFTKFVGKNRWQSKVSFLFTLPENSDNVKNSTITYGKMSGVKIDGVSYNANNHGEFPYWDVKGASGTTWRLILGKHADKWAYLGKNAAGYYNNNAIFALYWDNDAKNWISEEVAWLGTEEDPTYAENVMLHFHGIEGDTQYGKTNGGKELYRAATDLLNQAGRYDWDATARFGGANNYGEMSYAEFLDDNIDKAFTAYIKIDVAHDCYDPMIKKQYFNVRYHRPINVVGKEINWKDAKLVTQVAAIKDLVEIVDWNDVPVVAYNSALVRGRNTWFGFDQPKYADVYANANSVKRQDAGLPFEYYGISELAVYYNDIRSDHAKPLSVRQNKLSDPAAIMNNDNTDLVKDIPSLTSILTGTPSKRVVSLLNANGSVVNFADPKVYNHSDLNASGNGTQFGTLEYTNDRGGAQLFHIYVPIAVKYNWGNIKWDYILDDGRLNKNYTQTVWAVITVDPTYNP